VPNPSALFLAERRGNVSGSAVFAGLEGTRPVLVEVQALLSPSSAGRRGGRSWGWDSGRLSMLLAVLEARCGMTLGMNDVYLNIAGGLRIQEPAADLAVAAALVSAATDRPAPADAVYFGEVGCPARSGRSRRPSCGCGRPRSSASPRRRCRGGSHGAAARLPRRRGCGCRR
jgi:DNA repair protein RadA/Sms